MALPKWAEAQLDTQEKEIERLKLRVKSLTADLKQRDDIIDELHAEVSELKRSESTLKQEIAVISQ
jgi:hypothetical protein